MSVTQSTASDIDIDLGKLFSSLARNWLRILVVALAIAGLVFVMAWMATPHYKAETRLLIETRESVFTRPDATGDNQPILDEEGVTSQVEVISSTDILKRVARQLNLSKLPEFDSAANLSLPARLLVIAGLKSDPTEVPPDERVLKAFREKLTVYRVERSRVIVIEFSSEDPKLAAAVPNAIADAYLAVSRDAKLASNSDATEWLEPEIADLSKRVKEAEARVADFRAKSDLLIGQNNSVLATQQLSELSTELSRVRAGRAASEANAQSMRRALEKGGSLDALPEVMSSPLIQRLRERQVQLKSDIADLSTTLLENHPRIRALKSQLTDLDAQMVVEARNILKGIVTEVQTAMLRETQLTADLNQLKAASARAGEQEVELRALERDAASQRQLLESYMTRYREAASRQDRNYLPVDARVFSRAIAPSEPYFPKIVPMVGAAFIGSLLIMAVITLLQELFSGRAMRAAPGARFEPVEQVKMPVVNAQADDDSDAPAPVAPDGESVGPDWITDEIGIVRAAEKLIAEGTMRAVFVSPQGDEAAAAAVMVAREVSDAGLRVLLLDLTTGGAASQPMLDSVRFPGITNLLATGAQFNNVIHGDLYSDCHVIPIGTDDPEQAMRAADRLPIILESLTTAYDLVVIECGIIDANGIRRLVGENTEIFVSVLEPGNQVTATAEDLKAGGYQGFIMVTPAGYDAPDFPRPSRNVA
ncbi:chain-length determining protein [Pseudaminobacter arsenicus]|uniref:Chain-length determining protein n=1 Tax=Borborobacter arsenicus TaxID=1851146 RepID=A0A432V7C8_9HYPH|nr:Wzz/FepE/Etk N-terminal domain-containing protein [Pseudaminobacter arsenicus]RUM98074.1 chain-length determining protein [Pseudaminobacter arsenicus]